MRFFLYMKQEGGCDYTIACGHRLDELKGATTIEQARVKAEEIFEDCGVGGSVELAIAQILHVADVESIDLDARDARMAEQDRQRKARDTEAQERAELERLSNKYKANVGG